MPNKKTLVSKFIFRSGLFLFGLIILSAIFIGLQSSRNQAYAASNSSSLNFQARLLTAAGAVVPDGSYNVDFKLYNASSSTTQSVGSCTSGGSTNCEWEESYVYSGYSGATAPNPGPQLVVKNGYLSVYLGSNNPFPSNIDWEQPQYLTMNVDTNGTTSSGAITWDGEMGPQRIQMTALPYAFIATQLATNSGSNRGTLSFGNGVSNNPTIYLPNVAGTNTLCLENDSTDCGFAPGTNGSYIQNQIAGAQSGANFDIAGSGVIGSSLTVGTASGSNAQIVLNDVSNNNQITLTTGATAANYSLVLPTAGPQSNECIMTSTGSTTQLVFGACNGGPTLSHVLETNAHATNLTSLSGFEPQTEGDLIVLAIKTKNGDSVTNVIGGNVRGWSNVNAIDQSSSSSRVELWYGTVDLASPSTPVPINVTFTSTPGVTVELTTDEFTSGNGPGTVWSVDQQGTLSNTTSTTVTYPNLTATNAGELYWGYANIANTSSVGSSTGFTYESTGTGNIAAYNVNTSAGSAYQPTAGQSPSGLSVSTGALFNATAGRYINNGTNPQLGNFNVVSATSGQVAGVLQGNPSGSADILDLLNGSGTKVLTVGSTGNTLIQPSTTTTTALQVMNISGTNVLNVNTTASSVNANALSAPGTTGNVITTLDPPQPTSAVYSGGAGSAKFGYEVVAVDANGATTLASPERQMASANGGNLGLFAGSVVLTWTAPTFTGGSGPVNYLIYRTTATGATGPSASLGLVGSSTGLTFTDTGAQATSSTPANAGTLANATYYFKVTAIDGTGGQTLPSSEVSQATGSTTQAIALSWAPVTGARGYNIYISVSGGAGSGGEAYYATTYTNSYQFTTPGTYSGAVPTTNTAYNDTLSTTGNSQITLGNSAGSSSSAQLDVAGSLPTTSVATITTTTTPTAPSSVYVQGSYAYTVNTGTSTTNSTLTIDNISNPTNPVQVSSTITVCSIYASASKIYVQGNYAYVVCNGVVNFINVYNISNPNSVVSVSNWVAGNTITALYVQGNYAYTTIGTTTFVVLNISNPANIVEVGSTSTYLSNTPTAIYAQGNFAYVTLSKVNTSTNGALLIFNISNPASPTNVGSVYNGSSTTTAVFVQGAYAYVTNGTSGTMSIFNVSNSVDPIQVSSIATGSSPSSIYVQGHYAYVTNSSLRIFDVSNPAAPIAVDGGGITTGSGPSSVFVQGRYVYVANGTAGNLQIFDVGGAYVQQLQAGGTETGTLSVDTNATINGDATVGGGLSVSANTQIDGNLGVAGTTALTGALSVNGGILGGATINGLTVTTPTVTSNGATYTFTVTSAHATVGATYTNNGVTFTVTATISGSTTLVATGSGPPLTSGTLTKASGTGDATITFSAATAASSTWSYVVVAVDANGNTAASATGTISATDYSTLTSLNYNTISWSAVPGATSYKVYRTAVGTSPTTTGLLGTTNATFLNDQAAAGDGSTPPTLDTSGQLTVNGFATLQNTTNNNTDFQVQNAAGINQIQVDSLNGGVTLSNGTTGTAGSIATSWSTTTPQVMSTFTGTSVTYNGYIYQLGGLSGSTYEPTVYYARINANGTIGTWTTDLHPLTVGLAGATTVVYGGYIYEIGGNTAAGTYSTAVYSAQISSANGSIGAWSTTTALTHSPGIANASSVVYNGYIYEIGGYDGTSTLSSVYYAQITGGGTIGAWNTTTSTTLQLYYASSVVYNGYIYQIGGYNSTGVNTVYYAPINTNGTVGAWNTTATLLQNLYGGSSVVYNGYIYSLGGYLNGTTNPQNYVSYAQINTNGTTGSWTATTPLPQAAVGSPAVTDNGYIYELDGGSIYYAGVFNNSQSSLTVNGTGTTVGNTANSATAFQIQNAAGNNQFNVNTTSGSVTVQALTNSATAFSVESSGGANLLNVNSAFGQSVNADALSAPGTVSTTLAPVQPTSATLAGTAGTATSYSYEVVAVDPNGASTLASPSKTTATTANPVLNGTNTVTLSWTAVTGATNYLIYRTAHTGTGANAPTGNGASTGLIGASTSTSFVDQGYLATSPAPANSGSTANTTYYFTVTALDGTGGQTTDSAEVSKAVGANLSITLSWAPVAGARGYNVYYGTSTNGEANYYTTYTNNYTFTLAAVGTSGSPPSSNTAYSNTLSTVGNSQITLGNTAGSASSAQLDVAGNIPTSSLATITTPASPVAVTVQNGYAYTISGSGDTFNIYNVANPANPIQISTSTPCFLASPTELYVQGNYAYLTCSSDYLDIYNISNPASPAEISSFNVGGSPTALYVQGSYAYVNYSSTMVIISVSNPYLPVQVGSSSGFGGFTTPAQSMYVQGNYAYVVYGTNDGIVYNISNPTNPTFYTSGIFATGSNPTSIFVQGNYTYVVNSTSATMTIYNLSGNQSGTAPAIVVSSTATGTAPSSIYVQGHYAYVTNKTTGSLQIFDVSNPADPVSIGSVATGSGPTSVYVQGRYAYVTNGTVGTLQIFDLGGAYVQQLQVGGTETGTLSVDSNAAVNGDESIGGGLSVSANTQIDGNLGVAGTTALSGALSANGGIAAIAGGITDSGLVVSAPAILSLGANSSSATWSYEIVAVGVNGSTAASAPGTISSSDNATLTSANYNDVVWSAVSGATSYKLYRTAVGTSPTTTGLIATVTAPTTSYADTGGAGDSSTPPTIDTSGQITVNGYATFKNTTNSTSNTAFQVETALGVDLLSINTGSGLVQIGTGSTGDTTGYLLVLDSKTSSQTDPTYVQGGMYYNVTANVFRCGVNGGWQDCATGFDSAGITTPSVNGGTTTIQNLGSSASIPANYCTSGRNIDITGNGVYTTSGTTQSITFTMRLGTTTIGVASPAFTPSAGVTNGAWTADFDIICDAAPGSSVSVTGEGYATIFPTASTATTALEVLPMETTTTTATTGIATNSAQTANLSITYTGTANSSNTIQLNQYIVEGQ